MEGPDAVQRVYMVLKPYWQSCSEKRKPTLIILGRKALPHVQKHDRFWGFVAEVSDNMDDIASAFKEHSYETKTRGDRKVPPARPMVSFGNYSYELCFSFAEKNRNEHRVKASTKLPLTTAIPT